MDKLVIPTSSSGSGFGSDANEPVVDGRVIPGLLGPLGAVSLWAGVRFDVFRVNLLDDGDDDEIGVLRGKRQDGRMKSSRLLVVERGGTAALKVAIEEVANHRQHTHAHRWNNNTHNHALQLANQRTEFHFYLLSVFGSNLQRVKAQAEAALRLTARTLAWYPSSGSHVSSLRSQRLRAVLAQRRTALHFSWLPLLPWTLSP
ncbi:hypothetical protein EYF80_046647 [Liparis tanakae]|uniref:Uncharacterized protein n=1 Tax=Liparis tanakae TaxID=230148 RepID=A0A4Z2FRZ1_9TELE|nr:hypothetical protein EYF80_046647 [Liparis tanakae]